jgi:hypothetical protein
MVSSKFTNQVHISSEITEKIRTIYYNYFIMVAVVGLVFLYFYFGLTIEIMILTLLSFFSFVFFKYIYNDFVDLYLVGEYMIIKKSDKTSLVAPINMIKKCKSTPCLNLIITSVEFNLDGIKRKVFFVSTDEKISMFNTHRTEQSLKVA